MLVVMIMASIKVTLCHSVLVQMVGNKENAEWRPDWFGTEALHVDGYFAAWTTAPVEV